MHLVEDWVSLGRACVSINAASFGLTDGTGRFSGISGIYFSSSGVSSCLRGNGPVSILPLKVSSGILSLDQR